MYSLVHSLERRLGDKDKYHRPVLPGIAGLVQLGAWWTLQPYAFSFLTEFQGGINLAKVLCVASFLSMTQDCNTEAMQECAVWMNPQHEL